MNEGLTAAIALAADIQLESSEVEIEDQDDHCYIFNYPKIKTDISSSIVHSEFKYPTEFSCIKSLSEE